MCAPPLDSRFRGNDEELLRCYFPAQSRFPAVSAASTISPSTEETRFASAPWAAAGHGPAISSDIVRRRGGEIKVDSKTGEFTGTTLEPPRRRPAQQGGNMQPRGSAA